MNIFKSMTRRATEERAITAELKADAAMRALDELTRAVGTCKQSTYVDNGLMGRLLRAQARGEEPVIRAPHDQDPRVQAALQNARTVLGRSL